MVISMKKLSKMLICLSVSVVVFSIIFWNDLMILLGGSAAEVHHSEDVKITISGEITLSRKGRTILGGQLGTVLWNYPEPCPDYKLCLEWKNNAQLKIDSEEISGVVCHHLHWKALKDTAALEDCYHMNPAHWYGGGEVLYQHWPLEEWNMPMTPYLSGDFLQPNGDLAYGSVVEPYWLSSNGVGILVDSTTPLHVGVDRGNLCLRSTYKDSLYQRDGQSPLQMDYTVCTGRNVKEVHDHMRKTYFTFPSGWPDERMFASPVWSSWAQYKTKINDSSILGFARDIRKNNFKNSQLELDDGYQMAYGDFTFDKKKFPNPSQLVKELHELDFKVTIWVTPFANLDSSAYKEGVNHDYWVKDEHDHPGIIKWWNGDGVMLDFTNPEATKWYIDRLKKLKKETGIDSFKFDAGETRYLVQNYKTKLKLSNPNEFTTHYVNAVAEFGGLMEVRAVYKNQNQPLFVRMMDKHSSWGWDDGLKTLLTTAVTFGILGYPYILPDMIGGNAYDGANVHAVVLPERELFIRWLELTAFMPSMQYSVQPWQYDKEVIRIAQKWTTFHDKVLTPKILKIVQEETVVDGNPIIRPLWWIAPEDQYATRIDCEFLVGNNILVAPVVDKGKRSRDVYLPAGKWTDPKGSVLTGGRWYADMHAPLDEILYFTKQ